MNFQPNGNQFSPDAPPLTPDDCGSASDIATRKLTVTFIKDQSGSKMDREEMPLPQLAERIRSQTAADKMQLPWLKLATFGNKRTPAGSLRHNDNVEMVSGIEGDHDAGDLSFEDAVARIRAANIRALLYTSWSHIPGVQEKWRILVPLSKPHEPRAREIFTAQINGLLDGKLAGESFTLSQGYFYGHAKDASHRVEVIDGNFINLRNDTFAGRVFKNGSKGGEQAAGGGANSSGSNGSSPGGDRQHQSYSGTPADWQPLIDRILAGESLHPSLLELSAKMVKSGMAAGAVVNLLYALMEQSKAKISDPIRWMARRSDIWRMVETAEKFREGDGADAGAATVVPVDMWAKFDPPTLPPGILPDIIERFAFEKGMATGADPSGFAACALATCAGAIPDSVELQVKRHDTGWHEQARLWVAMVGLPSVRKSPILNASTKPLRELNDEMARNYHRAMDAYSKLGKKERETADKPKREALILNDSAHPQRLHSGGSAGGDEG
jgi:uncharacterized protein DUF3987